MQILSWAVASVALLCSLGAWFRARRVARRLEKLTESYWELRYEHGQLRARVTRLEPPIEDANPQQPAQRAGTTAFVPLSSLTRR